jgi:hypothetical protein
MSGVTIAVIAGAIGITVGFLLGVLLHVFLGKKKPESQYNQIVVLNGIEYVMHRNLVELMANGTFDDVCEKGILLNNIMSFCMRLNAEGWANQHKENSAVVSIKVNGDDTYELRCDPLDIHEETA